MSTTKFSSGVMPPHQLQQLFELLKATKHQLIGPKLEGQAITLDTIKHVSDLPQGWTDEQDNGYYRLKKRNDNALFGYNLASRSFKQFLFPPKEKLIELNTNQSMQKIEIHPNNKMAFIGIRACELAAILVQDKVFYQGSYPDPRYSRRRDNLFIVSLNCHTTVKTCFCVSMNTGPEVRSAFDLNISELIHQDYHALIIEAGSEKGQDILNQLNLPAPTTKALEHKKQMIMHTASSMGRTLDTENIKQRLVNAHDHPHWDKISEKCINCSNCTLVCPTCFCSKVEDDANFEQTSATRTRVWDSCFSQAHSYLHPTFVRESAAARYRQWLTHKLATWHDQFDTSGCVGCGRCMTWCPVGIDFTQEIKNFDNE